MENLRKDAINLVKNILSDTYKENLLIHIAQLNLQRLPSYISDRPSMIYGYRLTDTPQFLEKEGILSILCSRYFAIHDAKWVHFTGGSKRNNEMLHEIVPNKYERFTNKTFPFSAYSFYYPQVPLEGLHWFVINRKKALEWINKYSNEDTSNKKIIPITLPQGTKWENITLKFIDGHDVQISCHGMKPYKANYTEMGFQDNRKLIPNKQWQLLELLSIKNGEISWNDKESTSKIKKTKQLLSDALKHYFQLEEDPFYPYKKLKTYKIKITLMPWSGNLPSKEEDFGDNFGIKDYIKDQSPEVYDPSE